MIRMTLPTMLVLRTLYIRDETYGLQIIQDTGVQSGAVYPILARLEGNGWVLARAEKGDPAALRRPLRRYYRLTEAGRSGAENALGRLRI
jgi:DNA-binding PadR family transcriptional regulator